MIRSLIFVKRYLWLAPVLVLMATLGAFGVSIYKSLYSGRITIDQNDPRVLAERKLLEGTWRGADGPDCEPGVTLVVKPNSNAWPIPFPRMGAQCFRIDPARHPKAIDVIGKDHRGRYRWKGIDQLDGDSLALIFSEDNKRPSVELIGGAPRGLINSSFFMTILTRERGSKEPAGNSAKQPQSDVSPK
jgi:uncharacterized protein (TIGR03067 family)